MAKVKYAKFKGFLAENGLMQQDVAEFLGINQSEISQKLNAPNRDFSVDQIRSICSRYGLSMDVYFCAEQVAIEQPEDVA